MHVFGVSIPRFHHRYTYLKDHLKKFFADGFEIVGVDGCAISCDEAKAAYLSPGQIGCSLSHVAGYRRIVELDLPCALIVEDDCVLPQDICSLLAQLERRIRPGEVIQLYNWSLQASEFSTQDADHIGRYSLYYPMLMSGLGAATAYIISREAAERIIRANDPVRVTADDWSFFQSKGAVSAMRILYPNPVKIMPFESTIATSDRRLPAGMRRNDFVQFLLSIRRRLLFRMRERNVVLVDRKSPFSPG
jgi:glycosyl transferase, family 25